VVAISFINLVTVFQRLTQSGLKFMIKIENLQKMTKLGDFFCKITYIMVTCIFEEVLSWILSPDSLKVTVLSLSFLFS